MAFLTFRHSDNSVTEAQKTQKHITLGVPLTMYHVDANFKAINDELVGLHEKYGLSVSAHDSQKSLADIFGTNNVNSVTHTGFYRLNETSNVPAGVDESVLMHVQSSTGGIDAVTAIQLTAGVADDNSQILYYRTKQGENTWNAWQTFANNTQMDTNISVLQAEIDKCVKKAGDIMTGALTIKVPSTFTGNNNIISQKAIRPGNGGYPSSPSQDGFTYYALKGPTPSTRLGFTGLLQDNTSFSGVALQAINPANNNADEIAEIRVGWKMNSNNSAYRPYTYAPTPQDDGNDNLIATTGWVDDRITAKIEESNSFSGAGGVITGDVIIEQDLTVNGSINAGKGSFNDSVIVLNGPVAAALPLTKGTAATASRGSESNGFLVIDNSTEAMVKKAGARFWGTVNSQGQSTAEIAAINWVFPYLQKNLDDVITVEDEDLVVAFLDMVENHKMIVENSGLLTVAALKQLNVKDKRIVSILSGGNMDVITMSSVVQQGLILRDRIFTVSVLLPDKPGELCRVSGIIAGVNGNVIKLEHNQFVSINRSAAVELRITLEAFGTEHKNEIIAALEKEGYQPKVVRTNI